MRKQLNKTGATSFNFEQLDIELKGNIFLPVQALNELRREGFEKLTEGILAKWERKAEAEETGKEKESAGAENTAELFVQTKRELSIAAQSASKKCSKNIARFCLAHTFLFRSRSGKEKNLKLA